MMMLTHIVKAPTVKVNALKKDGRQWQVAYVWSYRIQQGTIALPVK